jgi:hypothetical protein
LPPQVYEAEGRKTAEEADNGPQQQIQDQQSQQQQQQQQSPGGDKKA